MTARRPRPRPRPQRPRGARRGSLAGSIVALTTLVAALAAALTGLIAWQGATSSAEQRESSALLRQAKVLSYLPAYSRLLFRGTQVLAGPNGEQIAVITADGSVAGGATPAVDTASKATLLAGHSVSATGILGGQRVLLVGYPGAAGGAVVLTEPYTVVSQQADQVRRDVIWPLLAGMLGAALAGALLARRTARPLVAASRVARRLAGGERGVRAAVNGPREVAEIGRALNSLDEALARSEARQRDFLQSVSHEMRTPLTALQGYADALADGLIEPDQLPEAGRTLAAETARLDRFLSDLLALARLEADDFRLEVAPTDLADLAEQAGAFWSGPCARQGVELRVETACQAPLVADTDTFRVRQLVDGLVQNALRATPAGRPLVIAVAADETGTAAVLQVRDGGPGLTEQDIGVAFDSGVLSRRYRHSRPVGSGLGLAIARRLAGRLGATIAVAGHGPEGGACFSVILPLHPGDDHGAPAGEPAADPPYS